MNDQQRLELEAAAFRRLVAVTTGLAAEGFVEISGDIEEGEQVVVGR